jgi:hypothetical protein
MQVAQSVPAWRYVQPGGRLCLELPSSLTPTGCLQTARRPDADLRCLKFTLPAGLGSLETLRSLTASTHAADWLPTSSATGVHTRAAGELYITSITPSQMSALADLDISGCAKISAYGLAATRRLCTRAHPHRVRVHYSGSLPKAWLPLRSFTWNLQQAGGRLAQASNGSCCYSGRVSQPVLSARGLTALPPRCCGVVLQAPAKDWLPASSRACLRKLVGIQSAVTGYRRV